MSCQFLQMYSSSVASILVGKCVLNGVEVFETILRDAYLAYPKSVFRHSSEERVSHVPATSVCLQEEI
jgi:hypothetical protein